MRRKPPVTRHTFGIGEKGRDNPVSRDSKDQNGNLVSGEGVTLQRAQAKVVQELGPHRWQMILL